MFKLILIFILLLENLYAGNSVLDQNVNLLFFGAFFMIIAYNINHLIITKSATYASYTMFHISLFIVMLFSSGMIGENWFELNIYDIPIGILFLSSAMLVAFNRDYLEIKSFNSKIYKSMNGIIVINLGLVFISAYAVWNQALELFSIGLLLMEAFGLLFLSTYLSIYQKDIYTRFYLMSFSFLYIALVLVLISYFGFNIINYNMQYLIQLAILIEAVGLSLAIAYKQKEIEINLKQNKLLFKELSHRVQNNLQQIISILTLQINTTKDTYVQKQLEETINRINAISLIHKNLQSSLHVGKIEMYTYLETLVRGYQKINPNIVFVLKCTKGIELTIDKVTPLALILNELITNSIKHAFTDVQKPEITIILKEDNIISFIYEDNGQGFKKESVKTSIGTNLINILSKTQLKGKVNIDSNKHYLFSLEFSNK